ncbi:epidermal growth factor receptor substrate 15-like 1 isoform X2 [Aphidius gifuensis]|uniref:epidermal growth factor receptor substrate 15-like 1 isoform X2 n=1 Tax=Aphidius gifuensis TaxID=684658 RepID=UPI001CDB8C89|nr:epidermal growth factor receptor substrate 15-like 1 isoform X2 [Aphidius gifuensis]
MAALPSPTQVAGSHAAIYEAYYNQVDPNGYGTIGAMEAAKFLKKSQLSDVILSKIWDMSDPQSRGTLDKSGMFVALKLCAFAQAGRELKIANLSQDIAPPKMGDIPITQRKSPAIPPPPVIPSVATGDWSIKPTERVKYDALFDNLQPMNGYIPGNKVKGVLMDSKLPLDTLGKIWDLADMDKDGMLDRHEFVIAMHLVYKALEKYAIPNVLPPELMPPGKRKDISLGDITAAAPIIIPTIPQNIGSVNNLVGIDVKQQQQQPQLNWVVLPDDQAAADKLFLKADMDMDGFVSGHEIKDIFLQSGLAQTVLAHIWGLCDIGQSGKLNKEQFALSMWLIKQRMRGIEPPITLTPEMIPPSFRKNKDGSIVENNNISGYSNPELDMISKDIQDLARERRVMEQDIAQKEADIKIKTGEIKSLQSELDTLAATLKQLETQKGEAQKRLNDLKAQVDKLRQQAEEQESVLRTQEEELNSKRQELEGLRQEEQQLEQKQNKSRDQLNELTKNLQNTQLQISQAKAKITDLEEQQRQMSDAIAIYDSALATGDPTIVPDSSLKLELEIVDNDDDNNDNNKITNGHNNDFTDVNGSSDRFTNSDPFSSSKNKDTFDNSSNDPFTNFDATNNSDNSGFTSDPFAAKSKDEAFDPFGDKKNHKNNDSIASKDAFGDDPFANLHAPTRAESPSPALPPKKAKQPPPRPAPPRPAAAPNLRAAPAPPTPSPTPDPFTNTNTDPFSSQNDNTNGNSGFTTSGSGFADFANFDAKPELFPNRTMTTRPTIGGRISSTPTPKLDDFTEDPFRNYRYEDPFSFADPFADDEVNDNNGNKKSKVLDPFGFETTTTTTQNNDLFSRGFESDFTNSSYTTKIKNNNFFTDNNDPFKNSNNNNSIEFVDTINQPTKQINFDEAFSVNKNEKPNKHKEHSITQVLKDKLSLKHGSNNKNKNGNLTWKKNSTIGLSEQQQLAWAAQQSLKAEEERRRIKAQEEADLALALELSKHD